MDWGRHHGCALDPRNRADVEESRGDESKGDIAVILTELETEEVDVPADEPCGLDDSSASHHMPVCCEEPVEAVFEKLSKSSKAVNILGDRISLDDGEAGSDAVQVRIPDSGGVWSTACVLMVAAVIVGMENHVDPVIVEPFAAVDVPMHCTHVNTGRFDLFDNSGGREDELGVDAVLMDASNSGGVRLAVCISIIAAIVVGMEKELNDEKNDAGQRTSKGLTTDAQAITEGAWSIAFDAEACSENAVDDPGGLFVEDIPCAWINDENREICWRDKGLVSASENFTFDEERDLLVVGLIMDESRGSIGYGGLNPDGISIKDVSRASNGVAVVTESVWDVGWNPAGSYGFSVL